jgi:hypothetical protein
MHIKRSTDMKHTDELTSRRERWIAQATAALAGQGRSPSWPIPDWWLELAGRAISNMTLVEAGVLLGKVAARPAWSHSHLSRFLSGHHRSGDLAVAFVMAFELDPPFHIARDAAEARAFVAAGSPHAAGPGRRMARRRTARLTAPLPRSTSAP